MPTYEAKAIIQGHASKDVTTIKYLLDAADFPTALINLSAVTTPLGLICDGSIAVEIKQLVSDEAAAVPFGTNAFMEALVTTYLDAGGTKKHSIRVPAPNSALVLADGMTIDTGNANLITYVQALSDYVTVSDGESIDTTVTNGMEKGYIRSRPKTFN